MEVVAEDEKNKKREHGYAFWRDGEEKRNVDVVVVSVFFLAFLVFPTNAMFRSTTPLVVDW